MSQTPATTFIRHVRYQGVSGPYNWVPLTAAFVKGCRTPAVTMRLRRTGLAGVGQASGEETAGSLISVFRPVQPMGI